MRRSVTCVALRYAAGALSGFLVTLSHAQVARAPEVIVSATRFAESVERLAVNASVITQEDIARSAARTLPELLGARAGLVARDLFGNNAALAAVDMRGFGATAAQNTLILVDGRRLNDIDQSGVQWSAIPLEAIERIEILRGSGAVQYGDGASAGVINIITRHPARIGNRVNASARYGSWDTREISGSVNAFGEAAGLHAFARNFESGGYRDNNQARASIFALRGTWSAWSTSHWWALQSNPRTCGAEMQPQFHSFGTRNGPVGLDPDFRFASVTCQPLAHNSSMRFSLDGSTWGHHEPAAGATYNPEHVYEYHLVGAGQQFGIFNGDWAQDNYARRRR